MSRILSIIGAVGAMVCATSALAQPEYVRIEMEIDIAKPADGSSWETVEATQFAGEVAYKVKLIDKLGDVSHDFFSKETGLKIGRSTTKESQMGPLNVTVTISDYTKHGEVLVPMQVLQDLGVMQQTFKFDSVSFDAIEDSLFELPAEIKALLSTE